MGSPTVGVEGGREGGKGRGEGEEGREGGGELESGGERKREGVGRGDEAVKHRKQVRTTLHIHSKKPVPQDNGTFNSQIWLI